MTTILIEHAQYVDDAGKPIAGGKLYVGTNGADPVATAGVTTIYSDRALTVPIANPQDLGTDGRALSKIWVDGTYSIQVNSLVGVVETQEFQDLDAGTDTAAVGTLEVIDIVGNNVITGTTSASISSYNANQQFAFTTTAANTLPVTLSIDTAGAKDVVKNNDQPILEAEFEASQVVIVAYNDINDNFEWVNQNNKVVDFYIGSAVASAATANIWVTDGNTLHVTGTVGITSFGTAASAGARRTVVFDDIVTLTNSANLSLPGGADYTTAAGDILTVYAETTTQLEVAVYPKSGLPANSSFLNNLLHVTDTRPSGTNGGDNANATWNVRTLQTVVVNEIDGASLSTNQITLPAGNYSIDASCVIFQNVGINRLRLRNITDAADELLGFSETASTGGDESSICLLAGRFTLDGTKVLELNHYTATLRTNGLGVATSLGDELYANIFIRSLDT